MKRLLAVCIFVPAFCVTLAQAQNAAPTTGQSADKVSQQVAACNDKVTEISNQLPGLQKKRVGLLAERKTLGTSGGDSARYKLSRLDQEISQLQKQIDGVSTQVTTEKKHCDDLAKPAPARNANAPASSQSTTPPASAQATSRTKKSDRKQ